MNILVFTASFHPSIGGLEKHTLTLVYEFLRRGLNVKVIAIQFQVNKSTSATFKLKDVDVFYQPGFLKTLQLYQWCDVLFMPNISLRGAWLLPLNPFKKLIISHNDSYLIDKTNIKTRAKLFLIKFATHNVAVSQSVANAMSTKSTVIYNCYDNDNFKIFKDEERIHDFVFLGRLVSQKGCDLLIRALSNLKMPFSFNIIGDGPERPRLEKLVQDEELQHSIKFLGILEGEHLARALNRHKTMVIPSLEEEGFGIVALEGMACGCGIIAADAGGLSEAVNVFGKIFKMGDQRELECLLEENLKGAKKSDEKTMSADLVNYLNAHSKESIAEEYIRLFRHKS